MTFWWLILVLTSLASGTLLVTVLVAPSRLELPLAVLGMVTFGAAANAALMLLFDLSRPDVALYVVAFIMAGSIGGWVVAAAALEALPARDAAVSLEPSSIARTEPAVVLLACVEPKRYSLRQTAALLQDVAKEGLVRLSLASLPLMFFAQKSRYRAVGGVTPAEQDLVALKGALQRALGTDAAVEAARCGGEDRLAAVVGDMVREGYRRVIICGLTVGEPLALSHAVLDLEALRPEAMGVEVSVTEPLAASEAIISMIAGRIIAATDGQTEVGVVLVGHGQSEEIARRNPSYDEAESHFMNRVRMRVVDGGLDEGNVLVAWAQWGTPDVTTCVRHLSAIDVNRIIVMPCAFVLDSIETLLDLQVAVAQARLPEQVSVLILPSWGADPIVVSEIVGRVRDAAT